MKTQEFVVRFCALALLGAGIVYAQGTSLGVIRGTVTDASGAVVPGVKVVVTDLTTNLTKEIRTDVEGNFEALDLKYGEYKVAASLEGFNTTEVTGVQVRGSDTSRVDIVLRPRGAAEVVTVTTEAGIIQTENQTIAATISNREILELPADSRDIYSLLYLNPNITFNPDDGFKFIGAQSWGANFALDGQRATGAGFGQAIGGQPSLESIGELTVMSNAFTAEYAGIANIRVTTKRGGAQYHGSLFYDNRNSALAAWSINDKNAKANFLPTFASPTFYRPATNFTETGGSFGGPVPLGRKEKRTFFQVAYERRWDLAPIRWRSTSLPHQTLLNGDFSKLLDASKPVVPAGVTLTAAEVASDTVGGQGQRFIRIPSRLVSPYAQAVIKNYFPVTSVDAPINNRNGRLTEYNETTKGLITRNLVTTRVDHDFSDKNRLYVTYNAWFPEGTRTVVGQPWKSLGTLTQEQRNHTLAVSFTRVFSPRVVNEVRGGLNFQNSYRHNPKTAADFLKGIGFTQADIDAYAAVVGKLAVDSYGQVQIAYGPYPALPGGGRNADRKADQQLFTFGDTLSWITGRHSIRGGFDIVRNHVTDGFVVGRGNVRGLITYSGSDANPLARLLLGLPADSVSFNSSLRPPMDVHNFEHGYFVQDDFRVSRKLTLNLGLRYEFLAPFIDANDLFVNFDQNYRQPSGARGRFVIPSDLAKSWIDPRMLTYGTVTASEMGLGRGLVQGDKNNLAPRLGAAYRLTEKTSLRGGWGVFYPTSAAQGVRDAMASSPFNQGRRKTNCTRPPCAGGPDPLPLSAWPRPFSGGALPALSGQPTINAVDFELQAPRIQQFNVTVERELGWRTAVRVSYLGTRMKGLIAGYDLNQIAPNDAPYGTTIGDGVTACNPLNGDCTESAADVARRPFSNLGDFMLLYKNIGAGRSNTMQLEVNRRMLRGFMFNASYTLLDQVTDSPDANSSLGGTLYNQFRPGADEGRDPYVSRHRFVAYGIWELPVGRGRSYAKSMPKWMDGIAGGWQTSFNMFIKSGTSFTPNWDCPNCSGITLGNVASGAVDAVVGGGFGGTYRATVTGDPYKQTGDARWDRSAFGLPVIGAQVFDNATNASRGFLRGPGSWAVNLGVTKNFRLTERAKLNLRAVFDNAFNHPLRSITGDSYVSYLGSFDVSVDPRTLRVRPIDPASIVPNTDFGRFLFSNSQENIAAQRIIRLSLRLTF